MVKDNFGRSRRVSEDLGWSQDGLRSLEIGQTSDQLSLNNFFDLIIPSMRTSKIENGCQGAPKLYSGFLRGNFRFFEK